jgi:hypothetical protein
VYEREKKRIVIRRDQLVNEARFCGTLLHELAHARSGETDQTIEFENELTRLLGFLAAASMTDRGSKTLQS